MSLAEIIRRCAHLVRRDRYSADLREEMQLHVDLRAARLADSGLLPDAARDVARRRFGHAVTLLERSRDMWGFLPLEQLVADVRFAVRRLRHRPGFSLSVIAVAALGIGATTAVFSAVDAAMLRPLPFVRPAELVSLTNVVIPSAFDAMPHPNRQLPVNITEIAAMPRLFSSVAGFASGGLNIDDPQHPRRVQVGVVTDRFFPALGVPPELGRTFTPDDGATTAPKVAILSDALWRLQFGQSDVLGKTMMLSGGSYTIVGVMPRGFNFPNASDLWIPLTYPRTFATFGAFRGYVPYQVLARLAPGVSVHWASRQLLARWEQRVAPVTAGTRFNIDGSIKDVRARGAVVPLQRALVGRDRRKAFLILMGATVLLLLIACANVANLLLSDAATRKREIALREVLGATYGRVIRQLLAESVLLALGGAAAGVTVAPAVLGVLRALMPADLAGTSPVHVDTRVLAFAIGLALVTGLVFGVWPALGTANVDAGNVIKSGGGHGATAGRAGRARRLLVTVELTLTVMLLVGSGLMLKSFHRLMTQDLGMKPDNVGTMELAFGQRGTYDEQARLMTAVVDRLAADPAIIAAGAINDLPLRTEGGIALSVVADGVPKPAGSYVTYLIASAGYFKAMGIRILRGRTFTADDDTVGERAVIINSAMAKKWWPNASALGRTLHFEDSHQRYTVVGITADIRDRSLSEDHANALMYFSIAEKNGLGSVAIVARSTLSSAALLSRMTDAVRHTDPGQAVFNVRTMESVIDASVAPRRTNTLLIAIFGALALVLAAFGVYAVVSYSVARRTREFGIRAALGAGQSEILSLVTREMAITLLLGIAFGLAGAWALSRVLSAMLYTVEPHDIATFAIVPIALAVPAIAATLIPAVRAMRVSPTDVMRAE